LARVSERLKKKFGWRLKAEMNIAPRKMTLLMDEIPKVMFSHCDGTEGQDGN
jgi:hypothetical protein